MECCGKTISGENNGTYDYLIVTENLTVDGIVTLTHPLAITSGGTGQISTGTSGQVLVSSGGSAMTWVTPGSGGIGTVTNVSAGTAYHGMNVSVATGSTTPVITLIGSLDLGAGGTNNTTSSPTAGLVLTSTGGGNTDWVSPSVGSVTSITMANVGTFITYSPSEIHSSGTFTPTLGILPIANGGTNQSSLGTSGYILSTDGIGGTSWVNPSTSISTLIGDPISIQSAATGSYSFITVSSGAIVIDSLVDISLVADVDINITATVNINLTSITTTIESASFNVVTALNSSINATGDISLTSGGLYTLTTTGAGLITALSTLTLASTGVFTASGSVMTLNSAAATTINTVTGLFLNAGGALALDAITVATMNAGGAIVITSGAAMTIDSVGLLSINGGANISVVSVGGIELVAGGVLTLTATGIVTMSTGVAMNISSGGIMNIISTAALNLEGTTLGILATTLINVSAAVGAVSIEAGVGLLHLAALDGAVAITSLAGVITLETAAGGIALTTAAGAVTIETVGGAVGISTGAGLIGLETGAGVITLTTASGAIAITCGVGLLTLEALAGDVNLFALAGAVTISTGTGILALSTGGGIISLASGGGAINVVAGAGAIAITTGAGAITVTTGAGVLTLTTGAGAITISTGSGAVSVTCGVGLLTLQALSGNLNLLALSGAMTISTGAGAMAITTGGGAMTLTTGGGILTLTTGIGGIFLTTGAGIISLTTVAGAITVSAGAGALILTAVVGGISLISGISTSIQALSGNVQLISGTLGHVELNGGSGGVILNVGGFGPYLEVVDPYSILKSLSGYTSVIGQTALNLSSVTSNIILTASSGHVTTTTTYIDLITPTVSISPATGADGTFNIFAGDASKNSLITFSNGTVGASNYWAVGNIDASGNFSIKHNLAVSAALSITPAGVISGSISSSSGTFTTLTVTGVSNQAAINGTTGHFTGALDSASLTTGAVIGTTGHYTGALDSASLTTGAVIGTTGHYTGVLDSASFTTGTIGATVITAVSSSLTGNSFAGNHVNYQTTTVSSTTHLLLTNISYGEQLLTGSAVQPIDLPQTSTLTVGQKFNVNNNSSSACLIYLYGGITLKISCPSGGYITFIYTNSGSDGWDYHYSLPPNVSWGTTTLATSSAINVSGLVTASNGLTVSTGNTSLVTLSASGLSSLAAVTCTTLGCTVLTATTITTGGVAGFTLPTTFGTSGQLLTSSGGGSALTWTSLPPTPYYAIYTFPSTGTVLTAITRIPWDTLFAGTGGSSGTMTTSGVNQGRFTANSAGTFTFNITLGMQNSQAQNTDRYNVAAYVYNSSNTGIFNEFLIANYPQPSNATYVGFVIPTLTWTYTFAAGDYVDFTTEVYPATNTAWLSGTSSSRIEILEEVSGNVITGGAGSGTVTNVSAGTAYNGMNVSVASGSTTPVITLTGTLGVGAGGTGLTAVVASGNVLANKGAGVYDALAYSSSGTISTLVFRDSSGNSAWGTGAISAQLVQAGPGGGTCFYGLTTPVGPSTCIGHNGTSNAGLTGQTAFNNSRDTGTSGGWEWNSFSDVPAFVYNAMVLDFDGNLTPRGIVTAPGGLSTGNQTFSYLEDTTTLTCTLASGTIGSQSCVMVWTKVGRMITGNLVISVINITATNAAFEFGNLPYAVRAGTAVSIQGTETAAFSNGAPSALVFFLTTGTASVLYGWQRDTLNVVTRAQVYSPGGSGSIYFVGTFSYMTD